MFHGGSSWNGAGLDAQQGDIAHRHKKLIKPRTPVVSCGNRDRAVGVRPPMRLQGIVRTDISDDPQSDVRDICRLARVLGATLDSILIVEDDSDYPMLFALMAFGVTVAVPDARHVGGWLPLLRGTVEVWALSPWGRVPGDVL